MRQTCYFYTPAFSCSAVSDYAYYTSAGRFCPCSNTCLCASASPSPRGIAISSTTTATSAPTLALGSIVGLVVGMCVILVMLLLVARRRAIARHQERSVAADMTIAPASALQPPQPQLQLPQPPPQQACYNPYPYTSHVPYPPPNSTACPSYAQHQQQPDFVYPPGPYRMPPEHAYGSATPSNMWPATGLQSNGGMTVQHYISSPPIVAYPCGPFSYPQAPLLPCASAPADSQILPPSKLTNEPGSDKCAATDPL